VLKDKRLQLRAIHRGERSDDDHAQLLLEVAEEAAATKRGRSMPGVNGAPDWLGYETMLWQHSEDLRQYVRTRRRLRGSSPLFETVAEIVRNPAYGKGRQNFVLVLGQFGGAEYTDVIAGLLGDPEVESHALRALRKQKDGRFVEEARAMAENPSSGAARHEAHKYLKIFG
jgi:hypothetical protein